MGSNNRKEIKWGTGDSPVHACDEQTHQDMQRWGPCKPLNLKPTKPINTYLEETEEQW